MALRKHRNRAHKDKRGLWAAPHSSLGPSLMWSRSLAGSEDDPELLSLPSFHRSEGEKNLDAVEGTPASSRTSWAGRVTGHLWIIGPHVQAPVGSTVLMREKVRVEMGWNSVEGALDASHVEGKGSALRESFSLVASLFVQFARNSPLPSCCHLTAPSYSCKAFHLHSQLHNILRVSVFSQLLVLKAWACALWTETQRNPIKPRARLPIRTKPIINIMKIQAWKWIDLCSHSVLHQVNRHAC